AIHELRPGHRRDRRHQWHQDRRQDQEHHRRVMLSTRGTVALLVAFTAFIALALPLDREGDVVRQSFLGLSAWLFLGIALALQPRELRVQVLVLVALATVLEVIGSIVWGA